MARKMLIFVSILATAVILAFVAMEIFWSNKYIDETISSGERWGIRINSSVEETLRSLQLELADQGAKVVRTPGRSSKQESLGPLSEVAPVDLNGVEKLSIFWDGEAVSDLVLEFDDGLLVQAHMKQQAFELP